MRSSREAGAASALDRSDPVTIVTLPTVSELRSLVNESAIAILMFRLATQSLLVANGAASELIGRPESAMLGWRPGDIWLGAGGRQCQVALSGLAVGALDTYGGLRQLGTSGDGPLAVSISVRRLEVTGGLVAAMILVPLDGAKATIRSFEAFLGSEAVDLAVATTRYWRIDHSVSKGKMVLGEYHGALAGRNLTSFVHPSDAADLSKMMSRTDQRSQGIFLQLRLLLSNRRWIKTSCLLFPLPDEHASVPRLVSETTGDVARSSDSERIAALERHLLGFAAELHAAGWRDARPLAADASRFAALDRLPKRQREIVDRLLRGERVASMSTAMYISASTVRNHLSRIYEVFGVHSQAGLLRILRSCSEEEDHESPASGAD